MSSSSDESPGRPTSAPDLLRTLEPEQVESDRFVYHPDTDPGHRVFGGLLLAQGLVAAGRTVLPPRAPHSLHADFLHQVHGGSPIHLTVQRLRETRAFSTRRTVVQQNGREVFAMTSSFHADEAGVRHQTEMPKVPPPEDLPGWGKRLVGRARYGTLAHVEWSALDVRGDDDGVSPQNPALQVWLRTRDALPHDSLLHAATLAYVSDLTMLAAVPLPPDPTASNEYMIASLSHSMWFFHALRADQWLLHDQHSPASSAGIGLTTGNVYTQDGQLVAAAAQEGLIRARA